ncbi:hypothetical protein GE061_014396 [Apolygus lucorum]|uniref:Uncharacterized protein n=1 Tax=Apolygus lucorum TaxID=248454 RepID=A0A6A4K925_APOLU|nr:hypothetical protein GE061_014396 [Apolygus lucorum]
MGHLQVATLLLLLPRIVWTQVPAAPTAAAANPLLTLNVPNLGNLLGGLLGSLLGTGNYGNVVPGMGLGNGLGLGNLGLGNMIGLFNSNNNLFYNQLVVQGLVGMTILIKLVMFALVSSTMMTGGLILKMAVLAMVLSWNRSGHADPHHHYRSDYRTIAQYDPWSKKSIHLDDTFLWDDRKLRTRRTPTKVINK